ncbi:hypothetical protein H5410_029014 [Solanum commersonii]|uniref:DUF4283 domain-containing protein n=1 Tax=Solanum commersonii TaxID=4109 RepID=A0A9J5Z4B8_SOLCO|nr:hypothetical protein H5410_029014 [Solanum commersonii]
MLKHRYRGEDSIFYNASFKSYDITRCKDKVGRWFEWMEHSRHQMKRVKISIKVLKWLVAELKPPKCWEDTKSQSKQALKRWNMKDHFAEFYCTLKYNESGRYISFIALQDKTQGIAVKDNKQLHRSYKAAFFRDRWVTEATERAEIQSTANRCHTNENPNLNDVRRWACNSWKSAIEVKVYPMNERHFMFELPSRLAAEHVSTGQWICKKMKLELEWWKPTTGCWPPEVRRDRVWIRLLGLPMNIWSQKVFKEIGNLCGGYIETEETFLKNHLHWARIKVQGDSKRIPREVEITCDSFTYTIPVWCEAPVTVKFSEKKREEKGKYPAVNTQDQLLQMIKEVLPAIKTKTRSKEIGPKFGPILLDPIAGEKARAQALQIPSEDIINIDISANQMKENKAQSQITPGNRDNGELEIVRHTVDMPGKNKEELGEKSTAIMVQPLAEENTNGGAEDVIPLGIQFPEEDSSTLSTSEWIQQNIIKLSSEFGVNLKGCEDRARELLMKIDSNKQESKGETEGLNYGKKRCMIRNMLRIWKADVVYFQETKREGEIANIIKEIWGSRWADYVQLEASGTTGGILIMGDKRIWEGESTPQMTVEREETWWELGAARGLFTGPWVLCGDFNTVRYPSEKFNCSRISRSLMTDLSEFIEDIELMDLDLAGGEFTWRKGDRHSTAARPDMFMISED